MAFQWIGKSSDGETVTLKKLNIKNLKTAEYFDSAWEKANSKIINTACVVDLETTGLNSDTDQIIEIGLCTFQFNTETGDILSLGTSYNSLQDPGFPLSEEVKQITGITDDMLKQQQIDWLHVGQLLEACDYIIAHNAAFDRPFIDKKVSSSGQKVWACSLKQIDWLSKGFTSPKLELLNIYHGFFTDSHRALYDAQALLTLLSFSDSHQQKYLSELIANAKKSYCTVYAKRAPFEMKDHLKGRKYQWENTAKTWYKSIPEEHIDTEILWLEKNVYEGAFLGSFQKIPITSNFKKP